MSRGEWTRSRYWHCHFLNSRHLRESIEFTPPRSADPGSQSRTAFRHLADWLGLGRQADRHWLVEATAHHARRDPALMQAVRLMVKEQEYHRDLLARLAPTASPPHPTTASEGSGEPAQTAPRPRPGYIRRLLGLRFELSRLMLWQVLHLELCRHIAAAEGYSPPTEATGDEQDARAKPADAALAAVAGQWHRDLGNHLAFVAERLTDQYAEFNFIRRNLRRWRLRGMFLWMAGMMVLRGRGYLTALHVDRGALFMGAWRRFRRVLEHVVPYHRDALLAALLDQQSRPWDVPPLHAPGEQPGSRQ